MHFCIGLKQTIFLVSSKAVIRQKKDLCMAIEKWMLFQNYRKKKYMAEKRETQMKYWRGRERKKGK